MKGGSVLVVPPLDETPWPTLGPQVCRFIEEYLVFGPGDLRGEPAVLDPEKRALIYRMYEVFPASHPKSGRRRFRRVGISLRKGSAKTELAAWIAACELHPDGPVRCVGWEGEGQPVGGGVTDPYIPLVAYTEEQSEELAYGTLLAVLQEGPLADDFDLGLSRIVRKDGTGRAVALAGAPGPRDGARTTFQVFDEPLALDTLVPTPDGWKTIGMIHAGDEVYDREGRAVRVIGESAVHVGRPCYRVRFVDGDEVVTDGAHRWRVVEWSNRPRGEVVRTTAEMLECGLDTGYGKRWRLPRPNGFDGVERELPIDPYVLGLWLGDGDRTSGYITAGADDADEAMALVAAQGYEPTPANNDTRPTVVRFLPSGLRSELRREEILYDKHIPSEYLFASRAQRLALLQGLMDSDGHVTHSGGHCTFVQNDRSMAEDVRFLVKSLGSAASLVRTEDERSRTGEMWKVHFSPSFTAFRMTRKADRFEGCERSNTWWPAIESIEPVESVPVKCIAVDADDHLFLVGRGLHLTHNTHRMVLDRQKAAHRTMLANLPKRRIADPWSLETTTAPSPGELSVAEATMEYADQVADGRIEDSKLFFFHRQASDRHDLETEEGLRAAIEEASGPVAEWSDIDGIVEQWQDPGADASFLERVWLNRPVQSSSVAFDLDAWNGLAEPGIPEDGRLIVLGFDGARFRDATALVGCDVETAHLFLLGMWERPPHVDEWGVPVGDVRQVVDDAFERWDVWRLYADPPYWEETVNQWAGKFGSERVLEWWTNRNRPVGHACRAFANAIAAGELTHEGNADLTRHIGNARRKDLRLRDDEGASLFAIQKDRHDSPRKMDGAMASVLAWEARGDAIAAGATQSRLSWIL